jgi:hypothetical protein
MSRSSGLGSRSHGDERKFGHSISSLEIETCGTHPELMIASQRRSQSQRCRLENYFDSDLAGHLASGNWRPPT